MFTCSMNPAPVWRCVPTSANSKSIQGASSYARHRLQFYWQVQQN